MLRLHYCTSEKCFEITFLRNLWHKSTLGLGWWSHAGGDAHLMGVHRGRAHGYPSGIRCAVGGSQELA